MRRQAFLLILLVGVAYLWWQSRLPSHYSEWAMDLTREENDPAVEERFDDPFSRSWVFASEGDSTWHVVKIEDSLVRYRVDLRRGDSLCLRVRLDLGPAGTLRMLRLSSATKRLQVIPAGDSARFTSLGPAATDSWIPWSPQALLYETIPALCDSWNPPEAGQPVTLVRIQPQTEVVVQLPGTLLRTAQGDVVLMTSGKELARVSYDSVSGQATTICAAGGRCVRRRTASPTS